jgi:DNA-binding transcriptional LysR family regulator
MNLNHIARRLKVHDLNIVATVVRLGSMGKAAAALNTSQPAISRTIADLEHALGVPLLERDRKGVRPTENGVALLDCCVAVNDALRQGIESIEFLADPTTGQVRVGSNSPMIANFLPMTINRLARLRPGISVQITEMLAISQQYHALRERSIDLALGRMPERLEDDIETEILFYDRTYVAAGSESRWRRRRKVLMSELATERWGLPHVDTVIGIQVADAFRRCGLPFPPKGSTHGSVQLRSSLAESGHFLDILPGTVLQLGRNSQASRRLHIVDVDLPVPAWPVAVMTLKGRRLRPAVSVFMGELRKLAELLPEARKRK